MLVTRTLPRCSLVGPPPVKADWWQLEYKGAALETIASSNLTALPKTQGGLSPSFGNPK